MKEEQTPSNRTVTEFAGRQGQERRGKEGFRFAVSQPPNKSHLTTVPRKPPPPLPDVPDHGGIFEIFSEIRSWGRRVSGYRLVIPKDRDNILTFFTVSQKQKELARISF